jgi:hypothetical protein
LATCWNSIRRLRTAFIISDAAKEAFFKFPQIWLWQTKALFVAYWILLLIGFAEILFFVCRACNNENCPMCQFHETFTHADEG